jgi:hypothetical protein
LFQNQVVGFIGHGRQCTMSAGACPRVVSALWFYDETELDESGNPQNPAPT